MPWWGKSKADFTEPQHRLKQTTFEEVEGPGVDLPDAHHHHIMNQPLSIVRPGHIGDIPQWFKDVQQEWKDFKAEFQDGDELWTFYADFGLLAERAGLLILREGEVIAWKLVWLS